MPCRTDYAEFENPNKMYASELEAVLCGVLSLDESVLNRVDWKEVGVPASKVKKWWKEHKKKDAERKKREQEAKEKAKLVEQIKTKLTPEEKKALGLD